MLRCSILTQTCKWEIVNGELSPLVMNDGNSLSEFGSRLLCLNINVSLIDPQKPVSALKNDSDDICVAATRRAGADNQ